MACIGKSSVVFIYAFEWQLKIDTVDDPYLFSERNNIYAMILEYQKILLRNKIACNDFIS